MMLAAMVTMDLEFEGIMMRLEPSPRNLRGLTHREWGDSTGTMPILMETGNPSQGRLRGKTDERLALTGEDKFYAKASELGNLFIPYEKDQPMDLRVARHTGSILNFLPPWILSIRRSVSKLKVSLATRRCWRWASAHFLPLLSFKAFGTIRL
jgi:hypothetical protein